MEVAATVILAAGIGAVLARTFARTFYRNAISNGLLPVECDTSAIREGDPLRIVFEEGVMEVTDERTGARTAGRALPPIMVEILEAGGIVSYIRRHGAIR
jgi:3-isopropylmalate/(R)-2-methylmalate dehydratase small subunit